MNKQIESFVFSYSFDQTCHHHIVRHRRRSFLFDWFIAVPIARSSPLQIARGAIVYKSRACVGNRIVMYLCATNILNFRLRLLALRLPSAFFLVFTFASFDRLWFKVWCVTCWSRSLFRWRCNCLLWTETKNFRKIWPVLESFVIFGVPFGNIFFKDVAKFLVVDMLEREDETILT